MPDTAPNGDQDRITDSAARVCTEGDFYGDDPDEVFALLSCDLERGHDGLHRDLARGIEWGANPYRSRRALTGIRGSVRYA